MSPNSIDPGSVVSGVDQHPQVLKMEIGSVANTHRTTKQGSDVDSDTNVDNKDGPFSS